MSLSDLKPCPFCGCDGWIVEDRSALPLLYRPQCKMCGGGLGGFQYRDNAIDAWNRRAEGVAALQQAGEPVAWRVRSKGVATWTLFASEPLFDANWDRERYDVEPLYAPQQTALVEGQSPELDEINGRLA